MPTFISGGQALLPPLKLRSEGLVPCRTQWDSAKITDDFTGRDGLRKDALRQGPRKDAVCEWEMSVGRLLPVGPADITMRTCNFQVLKLSIRRNLPRLGGGISMSIIVSFSTKKGAAGLLFLWRIGDSNSRLSDCEPDALPTELIPHKSLRATLPDIRTAKIIKFSKQILTVFSLSRQSGRPRSYLLS